jgi:hypothetical protein
VALNKHYLRKFNKNGFLEMPINNVKGFTIIADLKHMSNLWIRFGDICLDYTKPAPVKLKVFRRQ